MEQANLILTLVFNDETPNASLKFYNENFTHDYGIGVGDNDLNVLASVIRLDFDTTNFEIFKDFLTTYHHVIAQKDNIKEVIIETFRPSQNNQHNIITIKGKNIKDFEYKYRNFPDQEHNIEITFKFI